MNYNQHQINQPSADHFSSSNHTAYPAPPSAAPGPYVTAPPAGYPKSKDDCQEYSQKHVAVESKSRGDGFWKGCCAALCCCCLLDACF